MDLNGNYIFSSSFKRIFLKHKIDFIYYKILKMKLLLAL